MSITCAEKLQSLYIAFASCKHCSSKLERADLILKQCLYSILQLSNSPCDTPLQENILALGDLVFSALFAIDVTVRVLVLGLKFFKVCMNYVAWCSDGIQEGVRWAAFIFAVSVNARTCLYGY